MTRQVQVSLADGEIERIDRVAAKLERSRSWVLAQFIREGLAWAPLIYRGTLVGRLDRDGGVTASVKASGLQVGDDNV